MDSYIEPDSKMLFISDVFRDAEYFSSYSQNKIELLINFELFVKLYFLQIRHFSQWIHI